MFEQSLYQQQPVPTPSEGSDLFKHYELKTWEKSGRLYKILGISAIGNILALLIVAQTSLLTMKGCDSPLVGRVCSVLDVVYVSSLLFGTDREYVDAAYDDTKISDSEITFVDVTGVTPPLSYPEGYFQLANPEQFQASMGPMNNLGINSLPDIDVGGGSPFPPSGNLLDTPPVLPPSNPNAITGDLPSFDTGTTSSYKPPRPRRTPRIKTNPSGLPDLDDNAVAQVKPSPTPTPEVLPTPMSSDALAAVQINKKPLVDFADNVSGKWETKQIDLNQNFTLVLDGVITDEGQLDTAKSKFDTKLSTGDQAMIDVGKGALQALGKSGYLYYLKTAGVDTIRATLTQDDQNITVTISSVQKTPERANTVSSILGSAILLGKVKVENPSDERTLLNSVKTSVEGKKFTLNFAIPKPIAQEMINRKLSEASAKKAQQPKPSSNILTKADDKTAIK
ncbi:MAG: hypothetical protein ABL999_15115 [Pyrinomonadaceae bacterium]